MPSDFVHNSSFCVTPCTYQIITQINALHKPISFTIVYAYQLLMQFLMLIELLCKAHLTQTSYATLYAYQLLVHNHYLCNYIFWKKHDPTLNHWNGSLFALKLLLNVITWSFISYLAFSYKVIFLAFTVLPTWAIFNKI